MPLQPTQSEVVNFVLTIPPSKNPYHATANHISALLQPCPLPRWTHYVENFYGLIYLMNIFFAGYIIHLRLKKTKFYFLRFNSLGLIQLDRGFHCASSYMAHATGPSKFAICEVIVRDCVIAGRIDQSWSNLLTNKILLIRLQNHLGFLWMCLCHCALVKWGPIGNLSQTRYEIPYNLARVLNLYFILMIIWTIGPIFWSFSHLTIEFILVKKMAKHTIHALLLASRTRSESTYSPVKVLTMLMPLRPALAHVPLMVHYTRMGISCYLINALILLITYLPFLGVILRDFNRRSSKGVLLRTQERVLMQGVLHISMSIVSISILSYMGLHGSVAIGSCVYVKVLFH
ncbi:hypothetical protein DFH28DRAFT_899790 [Melampsora americana]|nr:hypothetical protein DFH28DRAFT_899790 [Melampsora americana]